MKNRIAKYKSVIRNRVLAGINVILLKHKQTVIDFNQFQLQSGFNAEGKKITPPYSPSTERIKKSKGDVFDRVTLYDTGAFYRGFLLQGVEFPFRILSSDSKTPLLAKKYGPIFGLDRESQRELNTVYLKKDIQIFYRDLLLLQ